MKISIMLHMRKGMRLQKWKRFMSGNANVQPKLFEMK